MLFLQCINSSIKEFKMTQEANKCPVIHGSHTTPNSGTKNQDWWPNKLNLNILRQHDQKSNPNDIDFDYKEAVKKLDFTALKNDLKEVMKTSQDWWPSDYGHYGPFFIRMTWHAAGTYRTGDGRGGGGTGAQRFAPLNSWPDNGNLDKARRLLWPIKEKYGNQISWADLLIVAGNVAIEDMGGPNLGTALGREDIWHPEEDIYWGAEDEWLGDNRYKDTRQDLENPLAAVQMGLIYVNPEGPNANPDPLLSAQDVRETFGRMAMNDEETVALVAGGHTFGKAHGAGDPVHVGSEPEGAVIEAQGFGWLSSHNSGKGVDAITSGIEGPWTANPTQWDNGYFDLLFSYDWELTKSPAGAHIWHPKDLADEHHAPQVDGSGEKVTPMMTTADMAMIKDPVYREISKRFHENPEDFGRAFARAWFKLLHRDMGPKTEYAAGDYPTEDFIWQDPIPAGSKMSVETVKAVKEEILSSGISKRELLETAWSSASTYRGSDKRGGANGARIRFEPQINWEANKPEQLKPVLDKLTSIAAHNDVSIADTIVIGGVAALEATTGQSIDAITGRGDATEDQTDNATFDFLEPVADGFRNYLKTEYAVAPEEMMLDKAQLLGLTPKEMTVLVAGMRSLGISHDCHGVWTDKTELNNKWLKTLLAMDVKWEKSDFNTYNGICRESDAVVRTATRCDLVFGSNSELRAIAEFYAQDDNNGKFIQDFISTWIKVMEADMS